uniref:AB hydrolase-1 domain-containing protein n=1 Tax=Aureoumbra lagunensis TaxID=44058 RepID=A0A7S3JXE7_9STRA|mmetsp:Transcript_20385/g.26427  ORF Transcript_20385/g.26427 Transcript_20385/m.26427 type:complete len:503 (-) Transcript_20385:425-1933(-)
MENPFEIEGAEKSGRLDVGCGRVAYYATSGSPRGEWTVLFLPLGVSRLFVYRKELSESARKLGLRLIAVDRPNIGGTSGCGDEAEVIDDDPSDSWGLNKSKRSRTVSKRLRTHSNDVAAVLRHIGASNTRVIGICAGTPFALHFIATQAGLASTSHLTLVTPWVQPYDCEYAWSLARVASRRWILGRSFAGYLLSSLQLGVAMPMLRSLDPGELLALLDGKLTDKERLELQATRARQAADILVATRTSPSSCRATTSSLEQQFSSAGLGILETHNDELVQDLERRLELALGAKALEYMGENAQAHCVSAMTADVRVCLSSLDEVLQGLDLKDLPIDSTTLLAADDDELVPPKAARWFADRLPGHVGLFVFHRASHAGVQTLRRNDWLKVAATHGAALPSPTVLDLHLSDDPSKKMYDANSVATSNARGSGLSGLFFSSTYSSSSSASSSSTTTIKMEKEDAESIVSTESFDNLDSSSSGIFGLFYKVFSAKTPSSPPEALVR